MLSLQGENQIFVRQKRELKELFGFEGRNKYEITNAYKVPIAFAAEQGKGLMGIIGRQFLGHWRSFELVIFDGNRQPLLKAVHPFRFLFQRLELYDNQGRSIGAAQQRFAFLYKRFDIQNAEGHVLFEMASAPWKIWTFPFKRNGKVVATLHKKWAGLLAEAFTDKDTFNVEFADPSLTNDERLLMLISAIFIDLLYFEAKASSS